MNQNYLHTKKLTLNKEIDIGMVISISEESFLIYKNYLGLTTGRSYSKEEAIMMLVESSAKEIDKRIIEAEEKMKQYGINI